MTVDPIPFAAGFIIGLMVMWILHAVRRDRSKGYKDPDEMDHIPLPKADKKIGKTIFAEPIVPEEEFKEAKDISDFIKKTQL